MLYVRLCPEKVLLAETLICEVFGLNVRFALLVTFQIVQLIVLEPSVSVLTTDHEFTILPHVTVCQFVSNNAHE